MRQGEDVEAATREEEAAPMMSDEERRDALVAAQDRALELLAEVERQSILRPGIRESDAARAIADLATQQFGVVRAWHREIVRAGPNTLATFNDVCDDRVIADDDIVSVDLGPVLEDWEADIGATFVIGDDPVKRKLAADLERVFVTTQAAYRSAPGMTGADLFALSSASAEACGWTFGGAIAGHIVGEFSHHLWAGKKPEHYIAPGNDLAMTAPDDLGRARHWILEIHLVDRARGIGGFYERLL